MLLRIFQKLRKNPQKTFKFVHCQRWTEFSLPICSGCKTKKFFFSNKIIWTKKWYFELRTTFGCNWFDAQLIISFFFLFFMFEWLFFFLLKEKKKKKNQCFEGEKRKETWNTAQKVKKINLLIEKQYNPPRHHSPKKTSIKFFWWVDSILSQTTKKSQNALNGFFFFFCDITQNESWSRRENPISHDYKLKLPKKKSLFVLLWSE